MIERRPAHIVIIEMLKKSVDAINKADADKKEGRDANLKLARDIGRLYVGTELLEKIIIPKESQDLVVLSLSQIEKNCSEENAKKCLSLTLSSLTPNPVISFVKEGGSFLSEEGRKLIAKTDDSVINKAAYENPEILTSLLNATNNTSDVYFRRKMFKAL